MIKGCQFHGMQCRIAGPIPGKMQNWFEDRDKLFFREHWRKMSSAWEAMTEVYLNQYWHTLTNYSQKEKKKFRGSKTFGILPVLSCKHKSSSMEDKEEWGCDGNN
jgi:hypothetical protein